MARPLAMQQGGLRGSKLQRTYLSAAPAARCPPAPRGQANPAATVWRSSGQQRLRLTRHLLQCRAASSSSDNNSSIRSKPEPELSEAEPGVQRQEDESRPAPARPDIAEAEAAALKDDTPETSPTAASAKNAAASTASEGNSAAAADSGGGAKPSGGGGAQTYREAVAEWFWDKKGDMEQFMAAPAVTVFGREYDFRRMVSFRDRIDFSRVLDLSIWPSGGDKDALESAGEEAAKRKAAGTSLERTAGQEHPAAKALREGGHAQLSFGFSAGGLLFPYYIGVIYQLHDLGVITPETKIGGASAGSLIAACYHSGLPEKTVTDACFVLCDDCRANGTRGRLRSVLQTFLENLLPDDIHERCSGKAYVAVTTVFPRPRGLLVSEFTDKKDFIAALLTSCHIPWWFDSSVWTSFRGRASYDGGLTNFIPLPPSQHGVRVCCFPAKQVTSVYDIQISPDSFDEWPHPLNQMVSWAFEPADQKTLDFCIDKGRADAQAWAEATGVLDVLKERRQNDKEGSPDDRTSEKGPKVPDPSAELAPAA